MNINDEIQLPCGTRVVINDIVHKGDSRPWSYQVGQEPYIYVSFNISGSYFDGVVNGEKSKNISSVKIIIQRQSIEQLIELFQQIKKELN